VGALADEYQGRVRVVEVDAVTQPDAARDLKVKATPTLIALTDGDEMSRHVGSGAESDIRRLFNAAEEGHARTSHRISNGERRIRLLAAAITGAVGLASGTWWLLGAAAVLLGTAVYDLRPGFTVSATVDATEAIRLMGSDRAPLLIDIRSARERASQQIPGSIHVPLDTDFESNIEAFDSDTGYLLYCATGVRSGRAVRVLQKNTPTQVADIRGGIGAWASNGGTIAVATPDQDGATI
jgi:phage shock protein E